MPGKRGNDDTATKRHLLDARNYTPLDETSIRYDGWRIVAAHVSMIDTDEPAGLA